MIKSKDYQKTELIRMVVKKLKRKPSECVKLTKNQLCNLLNKKKNFRMSSELVEKYKKIFSKQLEDIEKLPQKTKEDIQFYTEDSDLNYYLNHESTLDLDEEEMQELQEVKENLMTAVKSVTPLKENLVLYRGISDVERISINKLKSQLISTSIDRKVAESFSGKDCCLLIINVLAGSRVLPIMNISSVKDEFEILIPPFGAWAPVERTFVNGKKIYLFNYKN